MNKSVVMRTFNTKFQDFINDVISIFPDREELQISKNGLDTLRQSNPSLLIKVWYNHIHTPYGEEIEKGNVDFFLKKNYLVDLTNVKKNQETMDLIEKLKACLSDMNATNKEHSLNHIRVLSTLSVLYSSP